MINNNLKPEFGVYEDYEGNLHISDSNERIVLSDVFAYDIGVDANEIKKNRLGRMEDVARALNIGWSYL